MMTTIAKENLDERIERIKRRNEEIEKKYREAEEDRLMALKENAMVEIKPKIDYDDKDWPKAHKYDKIDFTYDVKPEKLLELEKQQHQQQENLKNLKRNNDYYKKFADGEGPPPDPAYNFLADAERDGITISSSNRKDSRQINNGNNNGRGDKHKRGGASNNNSFRGHGGGGINKNNKTQKNHTKNSQPEYEQWRNEREKIDEARINRQKIGDGKWKREWDNDKMNAENDALLRPEKIILGDAFKKSPIHNGHNHSGGSGGSGGVGVGGCGGVKMNRQNSGHNFKNTAAADCLVEKRANITVSVSQTGEVKSVKLTTAPAIGTGRVGPRQISKPQFSIQTVPVEREITIQQVPLSPHFQHKNLGKNNHSNLPQQQQQQQKVPNKSNKNANTVVVNGNTSNSAIQQSSLNVNPGKTKKDNKKHSPKQASGGQQQQQIVSQQKPQRNIFQVDGSTDKVSSVLSASIVASDTSVLSTSSLYGDLTTSPSAAAIQSPLSANEIPIVPIVDLSHKPEFQKRSIQDRLLRVRQSNNNSSQFTTLDSIDSSNTDEIIVPATATEILEAIKTVMATENCDKKTN